jgi:hypothetical protein
MGAVAPNKKNSKILTIITRVRVEIFRFLSVSVYQSVPAYSEFVILIIPQACV